MTTEVAATSALTRGALRGVVLDATTGKPLQSAQVYFPETAVGTLTDSTGSFFFQRIPTSAPELRAELIGYASEIISLDGLSDTSGYVARIGLRPVPLVICGFKTRVPPAVRVLLRDVVTGKAPDGNVRLVVRNGSFADTTEIAQRHAHMRDYTVLEAGGARPGTYDVLVNGTLYRTWQADDVVVEYLEECGWPSTRHLWVWLLPLE